jgi:hypothetical protein
MHSFAKSLLILGLLLGSAWSLVAQPFYNFQTIGLHTWYVSMSWNGQQPELGMGYQARMGWSGFTNLGAEWRFPIDHLFDLQQQEIIVGAYGPFRLRRRPYLGGGLHTRIKTYLADGTRYTRVTFATSLLPMYTFAAPLDDRPYFTAGGRGTFLLVLADKAKGDSAPLWLPAFGTELGGHSSLHLERTLAVSLNGFASRHWGLKGQQPPATESKWQGEGDLNLGSLYNLQRW